MVHRPDQGRPGRPRSKVAQAVAADKGLRSADRWWTGSQAAGSITLKELRPGSAARSEIRVLFVFDPTRSALLLVGGDKAGNWLRWYKQNIPIAEQLYQDYTTEAEE